MTERATTISLPDTLVGVIMARVDRLDEDLKQVLRLASVIGRSFFYRLLAAISEAERELDESLAGLAGARAGARARPRPRARVRLQARAGPGGDLREHPEAAPPRPARQGGGRDRGCCSRTASRTSPACSPTTTRRPRTGGRPRSTSSRPATRPGASPPTPRRWSTTSGRWRPTLRPSATPGTRCSGRTSSARSARPSTVEASPSERREHLLRALATLGHPFPATPGAMRRALVGQLVRQVLHRLFPLVPASAAAGRHGACHRGALPRVLCACLDRRVW